MKREQVFVVEGDPVPGLVKITLHRFRALQRVGLVEAIDGQGVGQGGTPGESREGPVVRQATAPAHQRKVKPDLKKKPAPGPKKKDPPPPKQSKGPQNAAAKPEAAGEDDDPLGDLPGGQAGRQAAPRSSSPAVQAQRQEDGGAGTPPASTTKPRAKRGQRADSSGS